MNTKKICKSIFILLLLFATTPVMALEIQTTLLLDDGWSGGIVTALNNAGHAAGSSHADGIPCSHAVVWPSGDSIIDLGGLINDPASHSQGGISDMTSDGVLVGSISKGTCDEFPFYPFIVSPQLNQDGSITWYKDNNKDGLNDFMNELTSVIGAEHLPAAINELNQFAGVAYRVSVYNDVGFFYDGSNMAYLTGDFDSSRIHDLNDSGQMAGNTYTSGDSDAVVWSVAPDGTQSLTELPDLGGDSVATGINNAGQVVGWMETSTGIRTAVIWDPQLDGNYAITELTPSIATNQGAFGNDINELGHVVGIIRTYEYPWPVSAFLWTPEWGLVTLAETGEAYVINDVGQMGGRIGGDAVIWTVPELVPSTPVDQVQDIVDTVEETVSNGNLDQNEANAITSTLKAASNQLEKGNTKSACNALDSFVRQIEAMIRSGRVSPEEGQALIDSTNSVIACN